MTHTRIASIALFTGLLAASGCGKSRSTEGPGGGPVTLTGGAFNGSDVTVESRWCTRCHGDASRAQAANDAAGVTFAPPLDVSGGTSGAKVGAHMAHLQAGTIRGGVDCATCHVVPANAEAHTHGVGLRVLAQGSVARGSVGNPTYSSGTCTATYCHGNFTGGRGSVDVTWTGGALTCGVSCHASPPAGGVHTGLSYPTGCSTCHSGTLDDAGSINIAGGLHINGVVDGGCTGCHGTNGRANGGITGVTYDSNQAAAPPDPSTTTPVVYVGSIVNGAHLAHVNPIPSTNPGAVAQPTGGVYKPILCTECHPDNTTGTHPNQIPTVPPVTVTFANATAAKLPPPGTATPYPANTPVPGNGTSIVTTCNTYCHNGVGGGSVAGAWSWTGAAATCGSCHGFPPTGHAAMTTAAECNGCHGETVNADGSINIAGGLHINGVVDGGGEPTASTTTCGGCHSAIFTAMSGTTAGTRHGLGSASSTDSGLTWSSPLDTNAKASRSCVNMCHSDHPHDLTSPIVATHENNVYADPTNVTTRANGSADRIGAGGTGTINRSKTDFDSTSNTGLCVRCHQNAITADGPVINAAAYGASAHEFTTWTAGSTWTWQFALHSGNFDRNCTKCHASFAEGNTPTVGVANAVHFNPNGSLLAGVTRPGTAGANGLVCFNCHGSAAAANGSQGNRSGVDLQTQFAKTYDHPISADTVHDTVTEFATAAFGNGLGGAARHVNCLDCHDAHKALPSVAPGPYSTGTIAIPTTSVACPAGMGGGTGCATATGTGTVWTAAMIGWKLQVGAIVYTVVNQTSGTSITVFPRPAPAVPAGTTYAMRFAYGATNTAGPALQGAWGARFAGPVTAWTAPGGSNLPKAAIPADSTLEATLCFKCHSGFYGTLPTSPSSSPPFAETDQAKEFNPANVAYHPILASNSATLGNTGNILPPYTRSSLMRCSDCHGSDSLADPTGPHGSSARFLLKGPNTAWSNALVSTGSTAWMPAGTFCINCHANDAGRSRFPDHSMGAHGLSCFNCHAAIPHGGPRPGMLVAPAGNDAAVPTPIGWDTTAPYSNPGTGDTLYIFSYPANNTTDWAETDCGCNGASHG